MKTYCWVALFWGAAVGLQVRAEDVFILPDDEGAIEEDDRTAVQILQDCTRVIPTDPLVLTGELTVRRQRGTELARYAYSLLLDWGANPANAEFLLYGKDTKALLERAQLVRPRGGGAQIRLYKGPEMQEAEAPSFSSRVRETDVSWLDLTLDFLWWTDVRFDDPPHGKCRTGRACHILLATPPEPIPGCSAMRIWVDRALHCIMQAEQLDPQGKPVRKMWVQNVKKMEGRWMISDLEIEILNSGHRTRLSVDKAVPPS